MVKLKELRISAFISDLVIASITFAIINGSMLFISIFFLPFSNFLITNVNYHLLLLLLLLSLRDFPYGTSFGKFQKKLFIISPIKNKLVYILRNLPLFLVYPIDILYFFITGKRISQLLLNTSIVQSPGIEFKEGFLYKLIFIQFFYATFFYILVSIISTKGEILHLGNTTIESNLKKNITKELNLKLVYSKYRNKSLFFNKDEYKVVIDVNGILDYEALQNFNGPPCDAFVNKVNKVLFSNIDTNTTNLKVIYYLGSKGSNISVMDSYPNTIEN